MNGQEYERIPTCDDDAIQVSTPAGPEGVRGSAVVGASQSQGTSQGSLTSRTLNRTSTAPNMSSSSGGRCILWLKTTTNAPLLDYFMSALEIFL